jgi:anti-anti-sigma regulatory factor
MEIRRSNGNVYLEMRGILDGNRAWDLINTAMREYDGNGLVVLNVEKVEGVTSFGAEALTRLIANCSHLKGKVVLEGLEEAERAGGGSRTACGGHDGDCKCEGRCTHCSCKAGAVQPGQL